MHHDRNLLLWHEKCIRTRPVVSPKYVSVQAAEEAHIDEMAVVYVREKVSITTLSLSIPESDPKSPSGS